MSTTNDDGGGRSKQNVAVAAMVTACVLSNVFAADTAMAQSTRQMDLGESSQVVAPVVVSPFGGGFGGFGLSPFGGFPFGGLGMIAWF